MDEFTAMEAQIREHEESLKNLPDEDGFITVRRGKVNTDGTVAVRTLRASDASGLKQKDLGQVLF